MINLPIYRAKKIDSDEYIEGFYLDTVEFLGKILKNKNGYISRDGQWAVVDKSTLSIHFPDMLDSQGNKIFASLQKNGKGGDILLEESRLMCNLKIDESAFREFTAIHTINGNRLTNEKILSDIGSYRDKYFKGYDIMIYDFFMMKKRNIKIIGIQQ